MLKAILFDIDGTLVDSNDAHANAWLHAFAESGIHVEFAAIRRCIGMGGDKLMPEVASIEAESSLGERIATRRGEIFKSTYLSSLQPFRDASALVAALQRRGFATVVASSAKQDELESLLKIAGVPSLIDNATSSDDAEGSKPDPDIVRVALGHGKAAPEEAVMIGDTPYDLAAASRAGVNAIAFRCGGWPDDALRDAIAIYDGPWDLLAALDDLPLFN